MSFDFKLPELGENIESADVIAVLVAEGDEIQAEQPVVEIETDKATVEVPCTQAGRVERIHVQPGDTVPVGGVLITVEVAPANGNARSAEGSSAATEAKNTPPPLETPTVKQVAPPAPEAPTEAVTHRSAATDSAAAESTAAGSTAAEPSVAEVPITARSSRAPAPAGPSTRRLARELGVELEAVNGTGPGGRITREDVMAAVRQVTRGGGGAASKTPTEPKRRRAPAAAAKGTPGTDTWGAIRREPLSKIRKTIAINMAKSAATIPHVTNFDDADVTELERMRKSSAADYAQSNAKLTMMPFLMKAVAHALKLHPLLNASLDTEAGETIYKEYVNLGIAVDTDRGLVVPVVRNVDQSSIPQLAQALAGLAEQTRSNRFALEDLRGGSFTISNLGAVGGRYSTPIINPPEVGVLLVGRSRKEPTVVDDQVLVRLIMPLSLSYDHRLVDGAVAARFLNEVVGLLETPTRLLLAP